MTPNDPTPNDPTPPVSPSSSHLESPSVVRWDQIEIAAPCSADWSSMKGDDCRRFCGSCHKNVFNLTDMTRSEAESTILAHEGRLCVRLYKRTDGTYTTGDCLVKRTRRRARRLIARIAVVVLGLGSVAVAGSAISGVTPESELADHGSFARTVQDRILSLRVSLGIDPEPVEIFMGEICVPDTSGGLGG